MSQVRAYFEYHEVLEVHVATREATLLVQQLHYVLKQHKVDEPGTFVRFAYADAAAGDEEDSDVAAVCWFCLGSLQKLQPVMLHVLVRLVPHSMCESENGRILCLDTSPAADGGDGRAARMATSHQVLLHAFYAQHFKPPLPPSQSGGGRRRHGVIGACVVHNRAQAAISQTWLCSHASCPDSSSTCKS